MVGRDNDGHVMKGGGMHRACTTCVGLRMPCVNTGGKGCGSFFSADILGEWWAGRVGWDEEWGGMVRVVGNHLDDWRRVWSGAGNAATWCDMLQHTAMSTGGWGRR